MAPQSPRPDSIRITCPNPCCGVSASIPLCLCGQRVRCRTCRTIVEIPTITNNPPLMGPQRQGRMPDSIGRFRILRELGQGGFGMVYLAEDPQLDREVALKIPRSGTLNSDNRVRRFLGDAQSAARLRHPNIVPVYDAGQADGQYFIATAYIEGGTLKEAIALKRFEIREVVGIVRQLADALAYAHQQGVVHRDIKPANVMLDAQKNPHLIDFGLAHRGEGMIPNGEGPEDEEGADPGDRTRAGAIQGTPAYMSPEAAAGRGEIVHPAMDQYSLGIVLYELLTGQVPFKGRTPVVLYNHIHTPVPSPCESRPEVDADLEAICLKAAEKDPKDRYASCGELAEDLRRWQVGRPVTARQLGWKERLGRWVRREPLVATLVGAVALSLLMGMTASLWFALNASKEAKRADNENKIATEALVQTKAAVKEKDALLNQSRRDQYFDLIARAERELEDGQPALARPLLDRVKNLNTPTGWEFDYLQAEAARTRQPNPAPWTLTFWTERETNSEWLAWVRDHDVVCRRCEGPELFFVRDQREGSVVTSLAVSPNGKLLAVGHESGAVIVHQAEKGPRFSKVLFRTEGRSRVTALALMNDCRVVWGCQDGTVGYLADAESKPELRNDWHTSQIRSVQFSPDGKLFVTCCSSAILRLTRTGDLNLDLHHPLESMTTGSFVIGWLPSVSRLSDEEDVYLVSAQAPLEPLVDSLITLLWLYGDACANIVQGMMGRSFSPDGPLALLSRPVPTPVPVEVPGARAPNPMPRPEPPKPMDRPEARPVPEKEPAPGKPKPLIPKFGLKYRILAKTGGTLSILDQDNREHATFRNHSGDVVALRCSHFTERIASVDENGICKLWRIQDRETIELQTIRTDGGFGMNEDGSALAWSEGDRTIKYRTLGGKTLLFDRISGRDLVNDRAPNTLSGYATYTHELTYTGKGAYLVTGASNGSGREGNNIQGELGRWRTDTGRLTPLGLLIADEPNMRTVSATEDGRVAWAGGDLNIYLGSVAEGAFETLTGHTEIVRVVRFSPDGRFLASGANDRQVILWNSEDHLCIHKFEGHTGPVHSLAWSPKPEGARIYSGDATGEIFVWDAETLALETQFRAGTTAVNALATDPEGRFLVTGSDDGDITIRPGSGGEVAHRISSPHRNGVLGLAFTPDGKRLASVGRDRMIRLWEVDTWREAVAIQSSVGVRGGLAFHPLQGDLAVATVEGVRVLRLGKEP